MRNLWMPILGGMFVLVIVAVVLVNRWTAKELSGQTAVKLAVQKTFRTMEQIELRAEAKPPVIDPVNDPLAPSRPVQKAKTKRVPQPGYIQEAPVSDPILIQ